MFVSSLTAFIFSKKRLRFCMLPNATSCAKIGYKKVNPHMTNPVNAIVINESDNVATAMADLFEGEVGRFMSEGRIMEISVVESIPQYHKFAIRHILRSEMILKYGEIIGQATCDISAGSHVHVHNMASPGRSDI
jgi:altronate dehydratase small subunit